MTITILVAKNGYIIWLASFKITLLIQQALYLE